MKEYLAEECETCAATGLVTDVYDPKGTARICDSCGGKGYYKISYVPWQGRRKKEGVVTVILKNLKNELLTYEEFENRYPTKSYDN